MKLATLLPPLYSRNIIPLTRKSHDRNISMYSQQSKEICKNNKYDKKLTSGNVYKFM
jgi:hypothetical protein